ncbi:hypothetical protein C922_05669 [Plasmodium inui San Antonio 1]|uniref:Uncharacterized protein n=1 Tax=Plasmodium inui San Antonio 1 TaxID=1237626 RepID=W7A4B9_9APIC|nr:hypothetical protein C922_05669 [Plasmodium inui San Antonio 1]EUD63949.1 hypothetical protein C922_05669 [Plasmodium inui San Antonio 1]
MNQKVIWRGIPRHPAPRGLACDNTNQSRFCFRLEQLPPKQDRIGMGVSQWISTVEGQAKDYKTQNEGYKKGTLVTDKEGQPVEWGDILDNIIQWCLKRAKDKPNNTSTDKYLGPAERRLWKGLMDQNESLQCNANSTCQKMLYLIGCIVYWLWKDDMRLIDNHDHVWGPCNKLREKILDPQNTIGLDPANTWSIIDRYNQRCQVDTGFKYCRMEGLSLVISVVQALTDLCPNCPLTGLKEIFGGLVTMSQEQQLYCRMQATPYPFCVVDAAPKESDLKLISGGEEAVKLNKDDDRRNALPLSADTVLSEPGGTTTAPASGGRIAGKEARQPDHLRARTEKAAISEKESALTDEQTKSSRAPGGVQPGKEDPTVQGPDPHTEGGVALPSNGSDHQEGKEQTSPGMTQQVRPDGRIGTGSGEIVGVTVGVGVMLLASAYGLYRIFGASRSIGTGGLKATKRTKTRSQLNINADRSLYRQSRGSGRGKQPDPGGPGTSQGSSGLTCLNS